MKTLTLYLAFDREKVAKIKRNQCEITRYIVCALSVKMKVSISLRVGRSFWYFRPQ